MSLNANTNIPENQGLSQDAFQKLIQEAMKFKDRSHSTFHETHLVELTKRLESSLSEPISTILIGDSMLERLKTTGTSTKLAQLPESFNAGCGGDKIENVLYRLDLMYPLLSQNYSNNIKLWVVMVGTNNLRKKGFRSTDIALYRLFLQALLRLAPGSKVLACEMFHRKDIEDQYVDDANRLVKEMISEMSQNLGGEERIVWIKAPQTVTKEHLEDHVHLDKDGYDKWDEYLSPFVLDYFENDRPTRKGDVEGFRPALLVERNMQAASNAVREKPNWWNKIKDPAIAANWRRELIEESHKRKFRFHLTEEQLDYVFKELDWYAAVRQKQIDLGDEIPIDVGIEGTRRTDGMIPADLKQRLIECVKVLEDVPEDQKDWHPGSNKQVLNLVHPSLYPFVAGRTRVTKDEAIPAGKYIATGDILDVAPLPKSSNVDSKFYSKKYQWLPTDFYVSPEGKLRAKSYINNLHPVKHKALYSVLQNILEKFLPMFDEVIHEIVEYRHKHHVLRTHQWYDDNCEEVELEESDYEYSYNALTETWVKKSARTKKVKARLPRPIKIPEFKPREYLSGTWRIGYEIQVIVKLANIELTPENPEYRGGTWHVEGMANENIVATGIYYYHCNNITESRLNFRVPIDEPPYNVGDDRGALHLYGVTNYDPLVQYLDGIVTKEDRCIVFPNIFQHQVQPFRLADPTKPGSRKILAFFLVNPDEPVLSTTNVPPQQRSWDNRKIIRDISNKLPPELVEQIDQVTDWPMDLEEAKKHHEELMAERRYFSDTTVKTQIFERPFSLCEH
ncbi:hypothetical protein FBU30_001432 [Linnemannia zychae]|nr:hypothetical protein FBU30_001432 [Linnemannia zychae]